MTMRMAKTASIAATITLILALSSADAAFADPDDTPPQQGRVFAQAHTENLSIYARAAQELKRLLNSPDGGRILANLAKLSTGRTTSTPPTWYCPDDMPPRPSNGRPFRGGPICIGDPTKPTEPPTQVNSDIVVAAISQQAFAQMPWAKPTVSVQPIGGTTFVTIPVFYQIGFERGGIPPGSVRSFPADQMLGLTVQVRPRVIGYRYVYGDGQSSDITTDPGGLYPTGRVTHTYQDLGYYQCYVEALYTADISIDGRPFEPINQTANVRGPATTITVKVSHNILIP